MFTRPSCVDLRDAIFLEPEHENHETFGETVVGQHDTKVLFSMYAIITSSLGYNPLAVIIVHNILRLIPCIQRRMVLMQLVCFFQIN